MQLLGPTCRISESSQDIRNIGRGLELIKWARLSIGRRGRRCIAFGCRSRRASWRRRNATGTKGYHNAWHRSIIACCVYQKLPANFGCSYDQRYFNSVSSKSAQDTPTFVASQAGGSSKSSASIFAQFLSTHQLRVKTTKVWITFSTFDLIILRFFAPFSTSSSSFCLVGGGGGGGRGLTAALAAFDPAFSFFDGRLVSFADLPMMSPVASRNWGYDEED